MASCQHQCEPVCLPPGSGAAALLGGAHWRKPCAFPCHVASGTCGRFDTLQCPTEHLHLTVLFCTLQLAWKAELQQPLSAISMRWDGSMVAVGTSSGSVLLHDTRSVSTKLPLQQFSAEQPVTALCWQHMPATRGSRGRHSLGTAQAAGSSVAPAGHADTSGSNKPAPAAAASRPAQPQQRGNGAAPAASSKPAVPPHKVPLVLPSAWDGTTPQSQGIKSTASSSSDTVRGPAT